LGLSVAHLHITELTLKSILLGDNGVCGGNSTCLLFHTIRAANNRPQIKEGANNMTLANVIRKMTDEELCEFICGMQIAIIRKFAQTFCVEIEEEIEAEKKKMFDGIAEKLKTEI
jgi:hypothetical protein